MIALLDVNILVALMDEDHVHHQLAHDWFEDNKEAGWASCPLTENGLVRIFSNPAFIDPPVPPTKPLSLVKALLAAAGAGLGFGLLLAAAILAALAFVDRTLRTPDDVERSLGLKVVGAIPLRAIEAVVGQDEKAVSPQPISPSSGAA